MNRKSIFKNGVFALATVLLVSFSVSEVFSYGHGKGRRNGGQGYHKGYHHGNHHGFRYLERLKVELNLSEKQVEKIFDIGTKFRQKYFKNRADNKKMDALKVEHRKEIEKVLTKDQKEKFNNNNYYGYWGRGWNYKDCPYRK